jgi:hypothetical protein
MPDKWADAHNQLVNALEKARDVMSEDEVLSAVDDVYHEDAEAYRPGNPKPPRDA